MEERKYTLKNPIQAKQTVEVRVSHGAVWVGLWLVHGKRLETSPRIPFRRGPLTGRPVWKTVQDIKLQHVHNQTHMSSGQKPILRLLTTDRPPII